MQLLRYCYCVDLLGELQQLDGVLVAQCDRSIVRHLHQLSTLVPHCISSAGRARQHVQQSCLTEHGRATRYVSLNTLCVQVINDLRGFGVSNAAVIELRTHCSISICRRQRLALAGWHAALLAVSVALAVPTDFLRRPNLFGCFDAVDQVGGATLLQSVVLCLTKSAHVNADLQSS